MDAKIISKRCFNVLFRKTGREFYLKTWPKYTCLVCFTKLQHISVQILRNSYDKLNKLFKIFHNLQSIEKLFVQQVFLQ